MADELLSRLDDRLAALEAGRDRRQASIRRASVQPEEVPDLPAAETSSTKKQRLPWVEIFIAVQFLWGALLFLPGAQPYRPLIRGLPYAVSVGLLLVYLPRAMRGRAPRGTLLLVSGRCLPSVPARGQTWRRLQSNLEFRRWPL